MEIWGKYSIAKAFSDNIEPGAIDQIVELLNKDIVEKREII